MNDGAQIHQKFMENFELAPGNTKFMRTNPNQNYPDFISDPHQYLDNSIEPPQYA